MIEVFLYCEYLTGLTMVFAADSQSVNQMNAVFVLEGSGSMFTVDSNQLHYEAVDLFLGLFTDTGNYLDAVVFDHNIILPCRY